MTNSIAEIENADCILVIGSNTTSSHPLVATRIFRAKQKGAKVIVADPRRVPLVQKADLWMQQKLGSDVALLNGMMNVILARGWHNQAFVDERTEGFEEFRRVIEQYPPERAAEIAGVSAEDIITAADWYANSKASSIVYCMGITQHTTGVDNVKTLANLSMLTGHIGRASTGVNPLRGQNNVQGACDMGGLPNVYPGYQAVNVPANKEKFEAAWKAKMSDKVGLTIPGVLEGLSAGTVKGVYIVGENPMMSDPDVHHVEKALRAAELLIVQDIFLTPTAELAHVVLPGASYAEKDGTFSSTERRVQRVRKAVEPVGEARADWEIIQDLCTRFGYPMKYESPSEILDEVGRVTPAYAGINFARLEGDGLTWPCPNLEHPGTPFLHAGKFSRGLGLFHAIEYKPPAEVVDEAYPFWLTTGRVHVHYHTGTMTRNSPTLHQEMPEGFLEINPVDAGKLGLRKGDAVKVASRRGEMVVRVDLTTRVVPGMVFMPFHFIESCVNLLTNSANDPIAKIPEYKVCAVSLEKAV